MSIPYANSYQEVNLGGFQLGVSYIPGRYSQTYPMILHVWKGKTDITAYCTEDELDMIAELIDDRGPV